MTFTQALLVVVAIGALTLALTCLHLLQRLDRLERAVQGGFMPPTRRLSREEFEHRFRRALSRSRLARSVDHGLVVIVGSEFPNSELASVIGTLDRGDGITVMADDPGAVASLDDMALPGLVVNRSVAPDLDIGVTPYAIVIDDARIVEARPIGSAEDLVALVRAIS